MKDIVTFETAVRLKEAGFPQPAPEAGQFWYYIRFPDGTERKNVLCVLAHEYPYQDNLEALPLDGGERIYNSRNTQVFAPAATDILRELGPLFDLSCDCGEFWCRDEKDWNPAEAVAEAWLKLNEKI
jgi:hypothetical protein